MLTSQRTYINTLVNIVQVQVSNDVIRDCFFQTPRSTVDWRQNLPCAESESSVGHLRCMERLRNRDENNPLDHFLVKDKATKAIL